MSSTEDERCLTPKGCGQPICVVCMGCHCLGHDPACPLRDEAVTDG